MMRVAVNTTFGLAGLFDIGSEVGMTKHKEDFGQTLGTWGVGSGPYLVLPLLGPSTLRDAAATPLDIIADPWYYKRPVRWRNTGSVLHVVDQRAALLNASDLLEAAALDRYDFVRDAYLQRRESKVRDGAAPSSSYEDDVGPTQENVADSGQSRTTEAVPVDNAPVEPRGSVDVNQKENGPVPAMPPAVANETRK
jgi:phospholipid-binding lipoprotein MlaA